MFWRNMQVEESISENKNFCRYCKTEIPLKNRHGDPQKYCKGHENKLKNPTWIDNRREKHPNWKGGEKYHQGYKLILRSNYPRTQNNGYVLEHVLVYEEYYRCCLLPQIKIHHKDGNRSNNDPLNLEPMPQSKHAKVHHFLEGRRVIEGSRKCVDCGSDKTKMKKYKDYEVAEWYVVDRKNNLFRCKKCYMRVYDSRR